MWSSNGRNPAQIKDWKKEDKPNFQTDSFKKKLILKTKQLYFLFCYEHRLFKIVISQRFDFIETYIFKEPKLRILFHSNPFLQFFKKSKLNQNMK
jgi:hypothetical protein